MQLYSGLIEWLGLMRHLPQLNSTRTGPGVQRFFLSLQKLTLKCPCMDLFLATVASSLQNCTTRRNSAGNVNPLVTNNK